MAPRQLGMSPGSAPRGSHPKHSLCVQIPDPLGHEDKKPAMSGRTLRNSDSSLLEGTIPLAETVLYISRRGSEVRRHVLAPEQGWVFRKRAHECSRTGSVSGLWVRYCSWSPRARFKCSLIPEPCTNEVSRTGVLLTQSLDPGAHKLGCGKRKSP